jgi:hypothetical protein
MMITEMKIMIVVIIWWLRNAASGMAISQISLISKILLHISLSLSTSIAYECYLLENGDRVILNKFDDVDTLDHKNHLN